VTPSKITDIVRLRLGNQRLTRTYFRTPAEVVSWLGAVQAQDYLGAAWGVGLRARGVTAQDVGRAFDDGLILRTHVMRPTWHFVAPADIRWLLALTGPRVNRALVPYCRKAGLDEKILTRSRTAIEKALRDGRHPTRPEIGAVLRGIGVDVRGIDLAFVIMRMESDAVICSGPRRGRQFTYALLEERVPRATALTRDEALAELTRRFFSSHGPATLRDYAWWSGLTVRDARSGIELSKNALTAKDFDGLTCWSVASTPAARLQSPTVRLLPNYDEYLIAHKDRDFVKDAASAGRAQVRSELQHLLTIDGKIRGTWKPRLTRTAAEVEVRVFRSLNTDEKRAVAAEAARYGRFVELPVKLTA